MERIEWFNIAPEFRWPDPKFKKQLAVIEDGNDVGFEVQCTFARDTSIYLPKKEVKRLIKFLEELVEK